MSTIKIIRIEHYEDGLGPFTYSSDTNVLIDFWGRHNKLFPLPQNDIGIERDIHVNEYCGYKSIEELRSWVKPNEIKKLIDLGFRIMLYEMSELKCTIGDYQVIFFKDEHISVKDITELF